MINEVSVYRLALLIFGLAFARAEAADYYVSTQGNDSNSGTASQPFRTITRAYKLAGPGVTINVLPGVYTDYSSGWGLHLGASGTSSSPIVLRSTVKGGAVIDGQNGSDRNKGIYLDGSYNIVDGFEIRGGPNGGITIWGNYNQILNNEIHHNGNPASTSTNGKDGCYSDQSTRNNLYKCNYVHDNGRAGSNLDHGFYLCGDNEMVIDNILLRNAATGLQIAGYTTVSGMKVYNNVVAYNATSGIILWQSLSGVDIRNNIIYQNGSYGINSWEAHGSGVVVDHNLVYGNGSGAFNFTRGGSDYSYTESLTITSAPQFVNSSSSGFDPHLSSSSPAIRSGMNLSATFTTDKDGAAWPSSGAWDQGAYRYGGSSDTTPPSVSVSAPANGATVNGTTVTVSASASDNVGVAGVQFKVDGANLGAEDTSAPYGVTWNTTTMANGTHTLSVVARDAAGNWTTANSSVLVNNVVNSAPTISSIANRTITAGTSTGPVAFTVGDAQTAAGSLMVSGSSSNPTLVPSSGIVLGGSGASRTVTVTPAANQIGTATITVNVSDGALSQSTSFVLTVNAATSGLSFASTSGTITAPFTAANGTISQPAYTSLSAGGRAVYTFTIAASGNYIVSAQVSAPNDSANSYFVNIDGEPTDPLMIWDIPITSSMTSRTVSWRGNGTPDNNQYAPKVFALSAGTHQLIVRGREGNCPLGTISIAPTP